MSQFFGCIALDAQISISEVAAQMTHSMSFFQGDAIGIYQTNEVFICNKFLFNTPESVNTTSICQNERYVLAATCRIDNRDEIAAKISLEKPHEKSDHEYILAAYTFYQEKCIEHFIGDFSFVVWDKQEQTLFMAKDHLGIKPLFHYCDENFLLFSTSIHAIKSVQEANLTLDKLYIARELKNFSPTFEDTFFENIKRLKPAHFIKFNYKNKIIHEQKYWELSPMDISAFKTEEEIYDELRRLFTEAVVCRTRTNKNIGCQLSGGMDSSAITVLLARNFDKNSIHTYSFVLSEKTLPYSKEKVDEKDTQQIVLNHANLNPENHHLIEDFHYIDAFDEWQQCNKVMGGYGNSDCIWQDTLFMNASKNQVGFIMSGFPGDECVSTYGQSYYYDYLHHTKIGEILKFISLSPLQNSKKVISYYLTKYKLKPTPSANQERNLLKPNTVYDKSINHQNLLGNAPTFKDWLKNKICGVHPTLRMESEFLYASQYGIEPVYPLADIRLIQFVYSLPTEMFRPKKYDRVIFREMCKNILPDSIRLQPKYNGAYTLAFADYWQEKRKNDLQNYQVIDYLELFHSKGKVNWVNPIKTRQIAKCKMDFLININAAHGKE
jgi:asparagine synthase (glutamine-hydrolysing)